MTQDLLAIAQRHGFTLTELRSKAWTRALSDARTECYAHLRARNWSFGQIGRFFNRDATTVCQRLRFRNEEVREAHNKRVRETRWGKAA